MRWSGCCSTGDSVSLDLGASDTSLTARAVGRVVTVSYRRNASGFYSGAPGEVTRLGTISDAWCPPSEMRCPLVGDVYLAVGHDGFVGIYNNGPSAKTYPGGFGAAIVYAV